MFTFRGDFQYGAVQKRVVSSNAEKCRSLEKITKRLYPFITKFGVDAAEKQLPKLEFHTYVRPQKPCARSLSRRCSSSCSSVDLYPRFSTVPFRTETHCEIDNSYDRVCHSHLERLFRLKKEEGGGEGIGCSEEGLCVERASFCCASSSFTLASIAARCVSSRRRFSAL